MENVGLLATTQPQQPILDGENIPLYEDFDTIDWIRDSQRDKIYRAETDKLLNERTKGKPFVRWLLKLFYRSQVWILLGMTACLTGILAGVIDAGVEWLGDLRFGYCTEGFWTPSSLCCREYPESTGFCPLWRTWGEVIGLGKIKTLTFLVNYMMYILVAVLFASISSLFVMVYSRWAAGSGICEVKTILGGFVMNDFLSLKTLMTKCIGLILSVSSGLNLGKEGPMVHVACCCADLFTKLFPRYSQNEAKKREILSAAAACGVSVAFGAPVGGVLFSLEEVSYYFPHKTLWRSFYCAAIGAIVLMILNPFHTGKLVLFQVKYSHTWPLFALIPFAIIGAIGGAIGSIFIQFNNRMCSYRRTSNLSKHPIREVACIAAVTALVSYLNPYLRGNSGVLLSSLFDDCTVSSTSDLCNPDKTLSTVGYLILATLIRLSLTIITFGSKIPAGIFIPSLAIGASMGRAVGLITGLAATRWQEWLFFQECASRSACFGEGVFALVGAVAVLCGATRMTVSLVVVALELTGELGYLVPVMLAVWVAKWVGDIWAPEGIYETHIHLNKYPFLNNKMDVAFPSVASQVINRSSLTGIELKGNSIGSLKKLLIQTPYSGFPVITTHDSMVIVGYITRQELRQALENALERGLGPADPCYFSENDILKFNTEHSSLPLHHVPESTTTLNAEAPSEGSIVGPRYVDLRAFMDETPIRVVSSTPMNTVFDMFKKLGLRYILVMDHLQHGRLMGIITKKDILFHLDLVQKSHK